MRSPVKVKRKQSVKVVADDRLDPPEVDFNLINFVYRCPTIARRASSSPTTNHNLDFRDTPVHTRLRSRCPPQS